MLVLATSFSSGQLSRGFHSPGLYDFRTAVSEMKKDDVLDSIKALVACREVMMRIQEACSEGSDASWKATLSAYLDPQQLGQDLVEAYLGKTQAQAGVLNLLKAFADMSHMGVLYCVVASHDNEASRWSDGRIQDIVGPVIKELLACQNGLA